MSGTPDKQYAYRLDEVQRLGTPCCGAMEVTRVGGLGNTAFAECPVCRNIFIVISGKSEKTTILDGDGQPFEVRQHPKITTCET